MPRSRRAGCRPDEHPNIGRRALLQAGCLSLLGASLADLLRLEAHATSAKPRRARAKSVVFIMQSGGPSQHETFDPKPDAPAEVRGEYGTTSTRTAGLRIVEYLPRLAQRSHLYSIVRTMYHPADRQFRSEHNSATYLLQTGTTELPLGETTQTIGLPGKRRFDWPSIGSLLAHSVPPVPGVVWPAVVDLPRTFLNVAGSGPGILGPRHAHWRVDLAPLCRAPDPAGSCPNCFSHDQPDAPERAPGKGPKAWWDNSSCRDASFRLPDLGDINGFSVQRLDDRRGLLQKLDTFRRDLDEQAAVRQYDVHQRQAMQLLATQRGKFNPFDQSQEPDRLREAYGREEWGQGFLVARRLVEAGVRMVQVNLRGWDTHQNAFRDLKGKLLPSLDHCLSGFLDDLEARGLLDETLVVMCGEMGRTPRVSPISVSGRNAAGEPFTPGRHHWGDVFPCFFAGAGIRAGQVIGQTDKQGGVPISDGYTPADLAATIFHLMGVGPEEEFQDQEGRPYRIYRGQPIGKLLA